MNTEIINNGTIKVSGKTMAMGIDLTIDRNYKGETENIIENKGDN